MLRIHLVALALLAGACDRATQATCPPSARPTYESFGKQFMADYCLKCHASDSSHEGADELVLDDLEQIRAHAEAIDATAGAFTGIVNTEMPPPDDETVKAYPSENERRLLAQWLACGAP
jgi:uncharacterized membrane protein